MTDEFSSRDWGRSDYVPPQRTAEEKLEWAAYEAWQLKAARWRDAVGKEHEWPARYEPEHNWWRDTMPPIRLLCPGGHRLVTIEQGNGWGVLAPVGEAFGRTPESGHAVVFAAVPSAPGVKRTPSQAFCDVTGCQALTVGVRCESHARRPVDLLPREEGSALRWQFRCPHRRCKYDGRWTGARLFMVYAVACYLGVPEVRLPA